MGPAVMGRDRTPSADVPSTGSSVSLLGSSLLTRAAFPRARPGNWEAGDVRAVRGSSRTTRPSYRGVDFTQLWPRSVLMKGLKTVNCVIRIVESKASLAEPGHLLSSDASRASGPGRGPHWLLPSGRASQHPLNVALLSVIF